MDAAPFHPTATRAWPHCGRVCDHGCHLPAGFSLPGLPMNRVSVSLLVGLIAAAASLPASARAASNDNTVEWSGVSHVTWQDRTPLCPVDGASFTVRFQTW